MTVATAIAVCITAPRIARADEAVEPFAVAYNASSDCPTKETFVSQITSRTAHARVVEKSNGDARVIHVVIVDRARSGDRFLGRLFVEDRAVWSSAREVQGSTCTDVIEALGLIAALTLDPKASTEAHVSAATDAAAEASKASNEEGDEPPAAKKEEPAAVKSQDGGRDSALESPPFDQPSRKHVWHPHLAMGLQADGSFVANLVPSGRLFGEIELARQEPHLLTPSFRVAIARSLDVERHPSVGAASLRFTEGSLEGCPLRIPLASQQLAVHPCAGFAAGVIDADGADLSTTRSRSRPWASISASARATWAFSSIVAMEIEAGALTPIFRETFFFEPGVPIYKAPILAALGRAGVAVHFP